MFIGVTGISSHEQCFYKLSFLSSQKTNLKQMDNLMPLMVTAQDPSGLPTAQDTDGSVAPCSSMPTASQLLSSPADAESSPCCPGSTVGQVECSSDLPSVAREENTDCSCRKKNKGMERKEEETQPAPTADSETVSDPDSCLQSKSDCGGKGTEGLPSCDIRSEETRPNSAAVATAQQSRSSGESALPGIAVMESGPANHFPGGELVGVSAAVDAGLPEAAGDSERGLVNPDTTAQEKVLEVGQSTEEGLEDSNVSTAGASDVNGTRKPVDKAVVSNCVSAPRPLGGDKPAESFLTLSNGETSIEKTAGTETSRRCEGGAGAAADQNPLIVLAAANDKRADGFQPHAPSANTCGAVSLPGSAFPGPQEDVMPNQKSEATSSHVQSQNGKPPICSATGDDKLCAASARRQDAVTPRGALASKHCDDAVTRPGSTTTGPPTAVFSEVPQANTATPDSVGGTQEDVGFSPLEVSDKEGQAGLDLKTPLTNVPEVVPHPHAIFPKAKEESVPDQAVSTGRAFSLAGSPGSESVTKDDALVPSQKEKGTATPEPRTATDRRDGGDSSDPDKQPLEDRAAGLPTATALDLQPSMGNTSPIGFGGEQEGACLSAAPEVLDIEGDTDSPGLRTGKAPLASDPSVTEEGRKLVVPEHSTAQGQDDPVKAVICSSIKEGTFPSGALREEQRPDPPKQELPGAHGEPSSAACAEERVREHSNSLDTPSACLSAETKHNKEVAPPVSLLTEGGAARSPVPPGASLAADSSQEALGAGQSSSPLLPGFLPGRSEALHCNGAFAQDVGVKNTQVQGKTAACEASGNMALDVAVVNALQGTMEARRKDLSRHAQDLPIPGVSLNQEKNTVIQGLPVALPDKGETDFAVAAPPEVATFGWEKGKRERASLGCSMGDAKGVQMSDDARQVLPQPIGRQLPPEIGLPTSDNKAPCRDRGTPPAPHAVPAEAGHLLKRADSIEEAASRIVDAVIERVRASGALLTEGGISHVSPASPSKSGPGPEQLESASTGKEIPLLPEETTHLGSFHGEAPGNPAEGIAGREEPEKIIQPGQGPEPATGEQSISIQNSRLNITT